MKTRIRLRLKQYVKMAAQNMYLPAVYRLYRNRKVDPDLVIFADAHHESRPENMQLLYDELTRRGLHVEEMYLDYQKAGVRSVMRHMSSFMKRYAQAGTVVICDNFLPAAGCRKKSETRLVQLWHACGALKKFGYDTADDIPENYRGNVFRGTDLVTVSAEACRTPFASAMHLDRDKVSALGVSRSDLFFDQDYVRSCREKLYRQCPKAAGKKIVLWAPTFRGSPGSPEVIPLDLGYLQRQLGPEYLVTAGLHPHMQTSCRRGKVSEGTDEVLFAADLSMSTQELMMASDLLIADYSSLIFEYLLLDKPLVLFVPDLDEYEQKRGFYMPYGDIPGTMVREEKRLADALKYAGITAQSRENREKRQAFLERYMSGCDGKSTGRIADWICEKAKMAR